MKEINILVADIKKAAKKAKTKAMIAEGIIKNYESTFSALTADEETPDAEEILSGVKTLDEAIWNLYWSAEYLKWIRNEIKIRVEESSNKRPIIWRKLKTGKISGPKNKRRE